MPATLRLPNTTPPGGWRYFQSESQLWFDGNDQGVVEMAERVADHRRYLGFARASREEAMADIHQQLCERLGPAHCWDLEGKTFFHIQKDRSIMIDSETAKAGTKAFLEFLAGGRELEERQEVFRRAEICRRCHLNTQGKGCISCNGLNKLVNKLLPDGRREPGLHICAVCGCGLQAKVNVTEDVIKAADEGRGLVYPSWCWIPPILEGKKGE